MTSFPRKTFNSVPIVITNDSQSKIDTRSEPREAVEADVTVRPQQQRGEITNISNLSCSGCCLESAGRFIRTDQNVSIKLPGLEYLQAIVRWVDDARAGVEFMRPLHPAVLQHLINKMGAASLEAQVRSKPPLGQPGGRKSFFPGLERLARSRHGATAVEFGIIVSVIATTALAAFQPQTILRHVPTLSDLRAVLPKIHSSSDE